MYMIYYEEPYEGYTIHMFDDLEKAQRWLKTNANLLGGDRMSLSVCKIERGYNPYDIIQGKFE